MMRRILAAGALVAAAALAACGGEDEAPGNGMPVVWSGPGSAGNGPMAPPLEIDATVTEDSYLSGETVEILFEFRNLGSEAMSLSPFPPPIELIHPWEALPARSYPAGSGQELIPAGESVEHTVTWDQLDDYDRPATPGIYWLQIGQITVDESAIGPMSSNNTTMDSILIEYPQGAIERTLEPGMTAMASGVNITLDRIEFSESKARVDVSVYPPDYYFPEGRPNVPVMPPLSVLPFEPEAWYAVDSGAPQYAGGGGFQPLVHNLSVTWDIDPLPADASQFTFTITDLNRWSGPWEFRVPLD